MLLYAASSALALLVVAACEAAAVASFDRSLGVLQVPGLFANTVWLALDALGIPFLILSAALVWAAGVSRAASPLIASTTALVVVDGFAGGAFAVSTYAALAKNEDFRGYLPFIGACLVLAVAVSAMLTLLANRAPEPLERYARPLLGLASLLGAVAAAALYWANYYLYAGLYPSLHLALMYATLGCSALALSALLSSLAHDSDRAVKRCALVVSALVLLGLAAASIPAADLLPYARYYAIVGQSRVLFGHGSSTQSASLRLAVDEPAPGAYLERFRERHPFPKLPRGFSLDNFNVVLITTEAARFRDTSLADPAVATTPNLRRLASESYVNTRAYSPSSGTLHSMSANLAMGHPSLLPLETWQKSWHGELSQQARTIAEVFAESGRPTFWVGHNHNRGFGRVINGLDQGFSDVELFEDHGKKRKKDLDARIARAAVKKLTALSASDERFFGWVFLSAPHGPYVAHYPDEPGNSAHDRYLQEIRYADAQLGVVVEGLKNAGLWDNTIIIAFSDHGEEFREHGGAHHKSTLYSEVTHVPFVLRIPGLPAQSSDVPMSTLFTFPWLLLHGDDRQVAHASSAIDASIGPVLHHSDGGILLELIGEQRMGSALVYPRYKIHYDFSSELYELYDLSQDAGEQKNIVRASPDAGAMRARMDRYRAFRQQNERHRIDPQKTKRSDSQAGAR